MKYKIHGEKEFMGKYWILFIINISNLSNLYLLNQLNYIIEGAFKFSVKANDKGRQEKIGDDNFEFSNTYDNLGLIKDEI